MAIEHGLTILSWYENLPKEEIPPEYLWDDSEGLDLWWQKIQEKKEYAASAGMNLKDVDDDALMDNELAREFK